MSYEPLHHKYRPKSFAELVGQGVIATTLTNALSAAKIAPAYLFTGPRGTGKTSSARILAKSLNCLKNDKPTPEPCGVCAVCQGITKGNSLDVIEIDAASNTGVENVRDIIEKAQFAPVQCRYKVYVVDECLTGDSLVLTNEGLVRIDNPNIRGKQVLSYNDSSGKWEFKKVLRWLDQGERQTLIIKTSNREIKCTGNHLIRTDKGWIAAKDVKEGVKILSPVSVGAEPLSTNLEQMDSFDDFHPYTSSKAILTGKKHTTSQLFFEKQNYFNLCVHAGVEKNITTSGWARTVVENSWQISNSNPFPQWTTSLETVESVHLAGVERVYDIEVHDNHNFVANGLTVHNCHMLSTQAFNALLKTLEEPPKHVVFVLATTDPQRVLPTIISRCQRFDFRRIAVEDMVAHLSMIATKESINITREAVTLVAQIAQGGLRDAESLLDQLSLLVDQVTPDRVWDLVGSVSEQDLLLLLGAIAQDNPEAVLDCTRKILDRGREPLTILQNLASFYRDLLIAKTANNRNDLVACTQQTWKALIDFAQHLEISTILHGQQHLRTAEAQLKNTTQPRLWLEIALLGLLPSASITIQQNSKGVIPTPKISLPQNIAQQKSPINRESPPENRVEQRSPINHETPPQNTAEQKPPINRESPTVQPTIQEEDSPSLQKAPKEDAKPVVSEPASTLETQQEVDSSEQMQLDQIWQQVVESLLQPLSKALFKDHGRLLSINNGVAEVGMPPKLVVKFAQTKLADVEAAFMKVYQQRVKVNFVSNQSKTAPTSEVKEVPKNNIIPQARPQPTPTDHNFINPPIQEVSKPAKTTPNPEPAKNNSKAQTLTSSPLTATNNWETDEVAIAAQRLAQFFDGAVIRFTDDTGLSNTSGISDWDDPEDSDDD